MTGDSQKERVLVALGATRCRIPDCERIATKSIIGQNDYNGAVDLTAKVCAVHAAALVDRGVAVIIGDV